MSRDRGRPGVWLAALVILLGTGAVVAFVPRSVGTRPPRRSGEPGRGEGAHPAGPRLAQTASSLPDTLEGLIDYYVASAEDVTARQARADALAAILREPDPERRLFAVLAALAGDPSPPEADPHWAQAIAGLAHIWEGGKARPGLDLMVSEARPRARRALASSFAHWVTSGGAGALPAAERTVLTDDFIDLYRQFPGMQKAEMRQALQALGQGDAADILQGKGLLSDDELASNRDYLRAVQQGLQAAARP